MKTLSLFLAFAFVLGARLSAAPNDAHSKTLFTFEKIMALKRLAEPVPSPDGQWVVFASTDVNQAASTKTSHLWIVPAAGGEARRLNESSNEEERPRFSPDGKRLLFTSKATDPAQLWLVGFDPGAGELSDPAQQVTSLSTGADNAIWSPDGKNIVFVSKVFPECKDDACNQQRAEELKKEQGEAKVFQHLFYRHWSSFTEFKRSHLFVVGVAGKEAPRDLTPGDHDAPPFSLGGAETYAISPDGAELAYTSNVDEVGATSTNNEIFLVPLMGGAAKKISTSPGSDATPRYSPDGKSIAWLSQARGGYESDRFTLALYDRTSGKIRIATEAFDR